MPYRIKNWERLYENAASRKITNTRWVPIQNKHDGSGFRRIMMQENAGDIFTAWILIVQIASKMPIRGLLIDDDGEITSEDMFMKTGFPVEKFESAIEFLSGNKIKWLEVLSGNEPITLGYEPDTLGRNGVEGKGTTLLH